MHLDATAVPASKGRGEGDVPKRCPSMQLVSIAASDMPTTGISNSSLMANNPGSPNAAPASQSAVAPPIEQFLSSLRTAWKEGAGRATDRPIAKPKRERRRPDPLVKATPQLREWFEAEPWRTSSELLSKLQAEYAGVYPSKVLQTLQRRLKLWRSEQASALLFGPGQNPAQTDVIVTSPESPPPLDGGMVV
jgi:hypothetical protein